MREENSRLKAVIKDAVDVTRSCDRPALRSAIKRAAEAAGIATQAPDRDVAPTYLTTPDDILSPESLGASVPSEFKNQSLPQTWGFDLSSIASPSPRPPPSSCMTFRLDSGLLGSSISTSRLVDPPIDIVPYIGPNRHSLAGQIYWYCNEASLTLLYQLGGKQASRAIAIAQQHPFFVALLRYVSTFCSYHYIIAIAEARLEFARVGFCKEDNLAAAKDSSILLQERVKQAYTATEQVPEEWLGPIEVEQAVRKTLRSRNLDCFEAAIRNDGTALAARKVLDDFIHGLWLQSTCHGDGPRWKWSYVRTQVRGLARDLSSCDGLLTFTSTELETSFLAPV